MKVNDDCIYSNTAIRLSANLTYVECSKLSASICCRRETKRNEKCQTTKRKGHFFVSFEFFFSNPFSNKETMFIAKPHVLYRLVRVVLSKIFTCLTRFSS